LTGFIHPVICALIPAREQETVYERGRESTLLPAGCLCVGGLPALEAAWFAVSFEPEIARALVVAPRERMPVSDRFPRDLLKTFVQISDSQAVQLVARQQIGATVHEARRIFPAERLSQNSGEEANSLTGRMEAPPAWFAVGREHVRHAEWSHPVLWGLSRNQVSVWARSVHSDRQEIFSPSQELNALTRKRPFKPEGDHAA